jgi:hypothetical protein
MWHSGKFVVSGSIVILVTVGSAWAQAQPPMPGYPTAPAPSASPMAGSLEGKVQKVDQMAGTVRVSTGWFGLIPRTLAVTGDTQVQIEGRKATLADVSEGAQVKAAYEVRDGKNVATHIDVAQPAPSRAPGAKAPQQ